MFVSTPNPLGGTGLLEWAGFGAFPLLSVGSRSHLELAISLPSGELDFDKIPIGQAI